MPKTGDNIYYRKNGLWEARYENGVDANGKKKYASVYGHTYAEAAEKRRAIVGDIYDSTIGKPKHNMTLYQLTEEWLYISQGRLKPATHRRYKALQKNHIEHIIGQYPVNKITTLTIHEFSLDRLKVGLQPQTVNTILIFIHSCLKYGQKQYSLPMPDIVYLSVPQKEMRVFSLEEQRLLTRYLETDTDIYKFGVLLALYTGLRIGELCALQWSDIQYGCIKVRRTIQRLMTDDQKGTELHVGPPKTATSMREIPIPSFLKEKVDHFYELGKDQQYVLGTKRIPVVEPRIMQTRFKEYLVELGISHATFHALRHTFATRCVECGFEIKTLSEVLGHANVQITLNKYVHSSLKLKAENMEKLKQIL